jgi:hypothetical protein
MKAKLIINGKELEVEISEAELKNLEEKSKKRNGYERVELEEDYYYVDAENKVQSSHKYSVHDDDVLCVVDNCYSDPIVAENNARADALMRQLRRFAVEHREKELDWHNDSQNKYYIEFDGEDGDFFIESCQFFHTYGAIYFDTAATADLALDTFQDELIWYFTEYKDSL